MATKYVELSLPTVTTLLQILSKHSVISHRLGSQDPTVDNTEDHHICTCCGAITPWNKDLLFEEDIEAFNHLHDCSRNFYQELSNKILLAMKD